MDNIHFFVVLIFIYLFFSRINSLVNEINDGEYEHCVCVPYWQCKEDYSGLEEEGVEVMDVRMADSESEAACSNDFDVCCPVECGRRKGGMNDILSEKLDKNNLEFRILGDQNEAEFGEFPWMLGIIEGQTYRIVKEDEDVSVGVAAIRSLMEIIKYSKSETVQELEANLKDAITAMKNSNYTVAAINSACELFLRFITLATLDTRNFEECKKIMLARGHLFFKKLEEARGKIVKLASNFIEDGSTILTHSRSRVVLQTLRKAHRQNKKFEVFVTISAPDNSGKQMLKDLEAEGIPCTLILDSAIGYIMERVNFIMVGAEGVVESGGIVNKVGSYTTAICAKEMKKPFYVLTESFKFSRLFPLSQQDLPEEYKYTSEIRRNSDLTKIHPLVDYTPPSYITLLFTDLGILTPSAVSDELIKLCGASLIHPQVAITAAHCVSRSGPYRVRAGEWNWQIKSEPLPHQDMHTKKIIIHPNFHALSLRNDIAIIILKSPFKLTENVGLACLPLFQGMQFDTKGCIAAGWGKNSYKKGTYQHTLKKVDLPIVARNRCLKTLREVKLGPFFELHKSFICAGGEANKDTCKGDGGSPLMCPILGLPGKYHQVGIVSWGLTCGLTNTPGVYVNVGLFIEWIDSVIKSHGFDTTVYKYQRK